MVDAVTGTGLDDADLGGLETGIEGLDGAVSGGTATETGGASGSPAHTAPVAVDDVATGVIEGDSLLIQAADLLANDSDALALSDVGDAGHGTVTLEGDGTVRYTPDAGFEGEDSFTYTVSDGNGGLSTATVTVTIDPVEAPSFAIAQSVESDAAMAMTSHDGHMAHPDDEAKQGEHSALLNLMDSSAATHMAMTSGDWSDPGTWMGGRVPDQDADVWIPAGISVTYDVSSNAELHQVRVDGSLHFATQTDTKMVVETLFTLPGSHLTIGTADQPVARGVSAEIVIADNPIDLAADPTQIGHGVVTHGKVEIQGAAKAPYLKLAVEPVAGATELVLEGDVGSWQVGDSLVVMGTRYLGNDANGILQTQDEEVTIVAIDEATGTVTLDRALQYDHTTPDYQGRDGIDNELSVYVGNASRNVTISSENPEGVRGHVMFMHNADVEVRYAEFDELGRTDKSKPINTNELWDEDDWSNRGPDIKNGPGAEVIGTARNPGDENVEGRYSVHIHRAGAEADSKMAVIEGNAVSGSPGWGIVHHDSHAAIDYNFVYGVAGAGIVSEDANETGQWIGNFVTSTVGAGRDPNYDGDANILTLEKTGDFGIEGVAFESQARQIIQQDNIAANSKTAWMFNTSETSTQGPLLEVLQFDPSGNPFQERERLGEEDAPVMGFSGNQIIAVEKGIFTGHRNIDNATDIQQTFSDLTVWQVDGDAINFFNYTNEYVVKDALFVEVGRAIQAGDKVEGINLSNVHVAHSGQILESRGYNAEGLFVDVTGEVIGRASRLRDTSGEFVSPEFLDGSGIVPVDTINFNAATGTRMVLGPDGGSLDIRGMLTDSLGDFPFHANSWYRQSVHTFEGLETTVRASQMEFVLEKYGAIQNADGSWDLGFFWWVGDRMTGENHAVHIPLALVGFDDAYLAQYQIPEFTPPSGKIELYYTTGIQGIDQPFEDNTNPQPEPDPQPEPEPDPQPEPEPEPDPDPQPEPQPEPENTLLLLEEFDAAPGSTSEVVSSPLLEGDGFALARGADSGLTVFQTVDVDGRTGVTAEITMRAPAEGSFDAGGTYRDYIRVEVIYDGGAVTVLDDLPYNRDLGAFVSPTTGNSVGDGFVTLSYALDAASTAQLRLVTHVTGDDETLEIDTVAIRAEGAPDPEPTPNTAPVAGNDGPITVTSGQVLSIAVADLLANDTDAEDDTLTIDSIGTPAHGTLVANSDGTFSYTPDAGFVGTDSFTYTVTDGAGGTATATVTVEVEPVPNTAPVAQDDGPFTVEAGKSVDIKVIDLLENDMDPDGDTLSLQKIVATSGGTVERLDVDGVDTLRFSAGETAGDASFTYTISDGRGGTDVATVALDVTAPPPAPDPEPDPTAIALLDAAVTYNGSTATIIDHDAAFETAEGALELTFTANGVAGDQGLFSKDSSGYDNGGHLTLTIEDGVLRLRAQTTAETLDIIGGSVSAGIESTVRITWADGALVLQQDGVEVGSVSGWIGLAPNQEPIVLGAVQTRSGDGVADKLADYFSGEIAVATFASDASGGEPEPAPNTAPVEDPADPPADDPVDPPSSGGGDLGVVDASMFAPYAEWVLDNADVSGNPFDVDGKAIFTHSVTGEVRETGIFYNGDGTYAFRFSGVDDGTWTFVTQSADADLDGWTGTVQVAADPTARGFVVAEGTKFAQQLGDGSLDAILPNYAMITTNLEELYQNPGAIQNLVDTFIHEHGFTGLHVPHLGGQLFDINSSTAYDGSRIDGSQGYDPDPRTFEVLEQLIQAAHEAGAVVHIWPWGDSGRGQTPDQLPGGENGEEHQRIMEYMADRLGPLPGWTLGYGFDNYEWSSPEDSAAAQAYFRAQTDFDHLTSVRPEPTTGLNDLGIAGDFNDGQTIASFEDTSPSYERFVAGFETGTGSGNPNLDPVFFEDRYRDFGWREGTLRQFDEADQIDLLWAATMAGGVANIWGNLVDPSTGQADRDGLSGSFAYSQASQDQISTWDAFFNNHDRFALDAIRANAFTGGAAQKQYALYSDAEDLLVLYAEDTDTIELNLAQLAGDPDWAGGAHIIAVNTEGPYQEIELGTIALEDQVLLMDTQADWAVVVTDH